MRLQTARGLALTLALGLGLFLALGRSPAPRAPSLGGDHVEGAADSPSRQEARAPLLVATAQRARPQQARAPRAALRVTFKPRTAVQDSVAGITLRISSTRGATRTVALSFAAGQWHAHARDATCVPLGQDGSAGCTCTVHDVTPGALWLSGLAVRTEGPALVVVPTRLDVPQGQTTEHPLELDDPTYMARLRVAVHDGTDRLRHARVRVMVGTALLSEAATEATGKTAELVVPPDTPLEVHAALPRVAPWLGTPTPVVLTLTAGEQRTLHLEMPPNPRVALKAESPEGDGVTAALSLWRLRQGRADEPVPVMVLLRSEPGRGWIGSLPAGRYRYLLTPRGALRAARGTLQVEAHREAGLGADPNSIARSATQEAAGRIQQTTVVLEEGVPNVRLRLRDRAGPVAGASVNFNLQAQRPADALFSHTHTDADGVAVAPPLESGQYWVHVWSRGVARELDLEEGVQVDATWPLPSLDEGGTLTLRGRVEGRQGASLGHLLVLVRAQGADWWRMRRTDRQGRFSFPGLAPAAYEVRLPGAFLGRTPHRPVSRRVILSAADANVSLPFRPRS